MWSISPREFTRETRLTVSETTAATQQIVTNNNLDVPCSCPGAHQKDRLVRTGGVREHFMGSALSWPGGNGRIFLADAT